MRHELKLERAECAVVWGAGGELAGSRSGGEHPEVMPLEHPHNKYVVSIYDVTTTVLVNGEAKENETGKGAALKNFTNWGKGACSSKGGVTLWQTWCRSRGIGAQERQLTQLGEGWYVESGVGEQQAKI